MSADLLRRAAVMLRERAEKASPAPWAHVDYADPEYQPLTSDGRQSTYMGCGSIITDHKDHIGGPICAPDGDLYPRGGYNPKGDMAYVALMHPPVALALASVFDRFAWLGDRDPDLLRRVGCDEVIATARAILREVES